MKDIILPTNTGAFGPLATGDLGFAWAAGRLLSTDDPTPDLPGTHW